MNRPVIQYLKKNYPGPLIGAEIGVGMGDHAQQMVDNLNIEMLYLIDHWAEYVENGLLIKTYVDQYKVITERFKYYPVTIIRKDSLEAVNLFPERHFDFIYIDANPSYQTTYDNINGWLPNVKIGGVLGGNNAKWEETWQAVNDCLGNKNIKVEKNEWFVDVKIMINNEY